MVKMILNEYRCKFIPAMKVYMAQSYIYFYLGLVITHMFVFKTVYLKYIWGMLPMLLGLLLSKIFPNQLSKLMFLCPMTAKDRKKYLITAYFVRVGIPIAIFILIGIICGRIYPVTRYEHIAVSCLIVSFILGANMHHNFLSLAVVRQREDKDYIISFVYGILSLLSQPVVWFTMIFYATMGQHGLQLETDYNTLKRLTEVVVAMNVIICAGCFKPVVRHGICYEDRGIYKRRDAKQ